MINRRTADLTDGYWQQFSSPESTRAQRLEAALTAFQIAMTAIIGGADGVQRFSDSTDIVTAILSASEGTALDSGGTVTREAWIKYQTLFLSFRNWLNTPTSAPLPTGTLDENDEPETFLSELDETPAMLIMRQPARVTP